MTTYATMRSRIADDMANDGALTAAQISNAIQSAIRHYEREPFWFNQAVSTFNTVAAQELYSSAALTDIPNIVRIDSATVTSGSRKGKLIGVENGWIEANQDGLITGEPQRYSYYSSKIRLFPVPSAVYTVTLSYIYKLADLSADADTNAWVDECEELIRQAAKKRLALDILADDGLAARSAALEGEAYDRIREENRQRNPQRELSVQWPFYRGYADLEGAV